VWEGGGGGVGGGGERGGAPGGGGGGGRKGGVGGGGGGGGGGGKKREIFVSFLVATMAVTQSQELRQGIRVVVISVVPGWVRSETPPSMFVEKTYLATRLLYPQSSGVRMSVLTVYPRADENVCGAILRRRSWVCRIL